VSVGEGLFVLLGAVGFFIAASASRWQAVAVALGTLPLVFALGAGGASRRALGTAVVGGMATATALAVFIVPVLYVVIERLAERRGGAPAAAAHTVMPEVSR